MKKYLNMAKAAHISGGTKLEVLPDDADNVKELKKLPYFEFSFKDVKNAPIHKVGVYAKDKDAAIKDVARIINEYYNPPKIDV